MPCRHPNAWLTIIIIREVHTFGTFIDYDYPISVKIIAACPECNFHSNYNASCDDPKQKRAGATAWPKWLLAHIEIIACVDAYYRKAFSAVHVPGVQSAS